MRQEDRQGREEQAAEGPEGDADREGAQAQKATYGEDAHAEGRASLRKEGLIRWHSQHPEWRLVSEDSPQSDHEALRRGDRRFSLEMDLPLFFGEANYADFEGWILGHRPVGVAIFTRPGYLDAAWYVNRVWVAPGLRGRGLVSAILPTWMDRYGSLSAIPALATAELIARKAGWCLGDVLLGIWRSPQAVEES